MNKKELIKRYLLKRKEEEVINLIIEDYEGSNLYLGIVYNYKINQYKVLYIPLDLIDNDVEEYACYQFIRSSMVDFIIEYLKGHVSLFQDEMFRFKYKYDNYYIQIKINIEREYLFLCNRYLPIEWEFLYDVLVLLFEHGPNMISEVCSEILSLVNMVDVIDYDMSYKFNLFKDKFCNIFSKDEMVEVDVKFLEFINNRYYSVVDNTIIIVEYNSRFELLNVYCSDEYELCMNKIYSVLRNISLEKFKCFYKIYLKEEDIHYLCFSVDENYLKVIDGMTYKKIPSILYKNGLLTVEYDKDNYLENLLN